MMWCPPLGKVWGEPWYSHSIPTGGYLYWFITRLFAPCTVAFFSPRFGLATRTLWNAKPSSRLDLLLFLWRDLDLLCAVHRLLKWETQSHLPPPSLEYPESVLTMCPIAVLCWFPVHCVVVICHQQGRYWRIAIQSNFWSAKILILEHIWSSQIQVSAHFGALNYELYGDV